ncbi:uncharacterized protein LOC124453483 [Xenia sp. Carnegie-2017]|uniref:uncharacterized protein LOC124453483 n=1 Tax=Xenia sp. Carnegie-2017 TaxID=2897299 RepID=UPI001F04F380|nr:uncharacterized protein LOC124453483 [Xenia sp. Carnegie-2017]
MPKPRVTFFKTKPPNPDQLGGFPELSIKQGQKVIFLNVHEHETLWWNIRDVNSGKCGYIPGSYLMLGHKFVAVSLSIEISSFSYSLWEYQLSNFNTTKTLLYCEICDKQLNGPKPYQAHMVSKAHKEEVAAQSS